MKGEEALRSETDVTHVSRFTDRIAQILALMVNGVSHPIYDT